jgi:hypothetical protein
MKQIVLVCSIAILLAISCTKKQEILTQQEASDLQSISKKNMQVDNVNINSNVNKGKRTTFDTKHKTCHGAPSNCGPLIVVEKIKNPFTDLDLAIAGGADKVIIFFNSTSGQKLSEEFFPEYTQTLKNGINTVISTNNTLSNQIFYLFGDSKSLTTNNAEYVIPVKN